MTRVNEELSIKWKLGDLDDKRAVEDLILRSNRRLIFAGINKYKQFYDEMEMEDLFNDVCISVIEALSKYDPTYGIYFTSFWARYMHGAASHNKYKFYKWNGAKTNRENGNLLRDNDGKVVCGQSVYTESELIKEDKDGEDIPIKGSDMSTPPEKMEHSVDELLDKCKTLTERELIVMRCMYKYNFTCGQAGARVGLTTESARQDRKSAIKKLQKFYVHNQTKGKYNGTK